ncbi:substrate-binding domain-containing protein [Mobilicoccus caccae]|uniref:Sugar ABC transporter substrate-binding protein n=1 Tax=Mobilicoccus caccae TaxID=1859295 RepID=A0ABQ6ITY0_9MICO|nr:sugar-binding protein [Mobilicoccus caccae]GMA40896.1 sugar ABC transporter substrate-binding protein [Mobilicoccus caccae]
MRRITTMAVALTAASALALAGCGRAEENPGNGGGGQPGATGGGTGAAGGGFEGNALIGVALPQKTSENWVLAESLFNEDLKAAGFQADVQFANNGVSEQQNQIQSMVTKGAKVIVVGAIDGGQISSQVQAAKDAGATVIAYDRLIKNTEAVDYYVAYDNYKVGQLQGQALLDGMKAKKPNGPYNIELFAGSPDDANAKVFFDGAMNILKPKLDDGTLKVASGQTDFTQAVTQGWKAENAQKRMDTLLAGSYSSAELDGVLSPNDTLARAIITSVKQAGKDVPVVTGQDSEVESVKSIVAGEQYSTINKDTRNLVKATVGMIKALQAGQQPEVNDTQQYNNGVKVVPANLLEPMIVTKENVKEAYAGDPTLSKLTNG